ncbi:MAG: hypothetical protein ABR550_06170, partial [Wenzhouxiangellaceae bacterium]
MSRDLTVDDRERRLRPVAAGSNPLVAYDPLQAPMEDDTIDLRDYWRMLVKRKWVVVSVVLIIVVAALLSTT